MKPSMILQDLDDAVKVPYDSIKETQIRKSE